MIRHYLNVLNSSRILQFKREFSHQTLVLNLRASGCIQFKLLASVFGVECEVKNSRCGEYPLHNRSLDY